jgi:restriction endonuclease S subunit
MTKFLDIFTPIQKGNFGLTDEAIYKSIQYGGQFVPVYGGTQEHNTTDRFVSEYGKTKYDEPITIFNGDGIIISLDGSSGCMTYVISRRFALNHHAGFFQLREQAKQSVVPEFFSLFFQKQLQEASISEGSKTLTPTMIESMDFDIPQYDVQKKIMLEIRPLLKVKEKVQNLLLRMNSIRERALSIEYRNYQAKDIPISDILDCYGGNTGLTEKEIYQRILTEGQRYEVLSASTSEGTQLGSIPKCHLNRRELEVLEDKEGILVIRKGKAGITYYRAKGKYALTDDAYFLTVKEDCKYDVNLKWLIAQYRQIFIEYSSSSDNGTWNMTGFFENVKIDIPSYEYQLELAKKYDCLELLQTKIESVSLKIARLFTRQIVA